MGTIWISDKCQWNHRNIWHDRDSNPNLPLQKPVVLPTVPWEQLQVPTNVSQQLKKLAQQRLEHGPTTSEPCCHTPCAMGTIGMEFPTNVCELIKITNNKQPSRNVFPHSLHYGTMFATNWSSNGGLAAEASVTCRRSQWSNSSHFSLLFSPPKRFFVTWPPLLS